MCTLVLAHQVFPSAPLVVAANRDEFLARAASGPRVYPGEPRVLMPRDEVAGGSWLGLNSHGLFVGITNRAGSTVDRARRSRGLLVADALRQASAADLHTWMGKAKAGDYNSYHLLYADGRDAFVTWSDGERVTQYRVEPGVHVVTERSLGADDRGRTELVERLFADKVRAEAPDLDALHALLVEHGPEHEPFAGTCVHADAFGYGTRSSFLYVGGASPRAAWVEGHPCRNPRRDLDELLRELSD